MPPKPPLALLLLLLPSKYPQPPPGFDADAADWEAEPAAEAIVDVVKLEVVRDCGSGSCRCWSTSYLRPLTSGPAESVWPLVLVGVGTCASTWAFTWLWSLWTSGEFHGSCSGLSIVGCRARGGLGIVDCCCEKAGFAGVVGCWGGLAASSEVSGNAGWTGFAFLLVKADDDNWDDNWGRGRSRRLSG